MAEPESNRASASRRGIIVGAAFGILIGVILVNTVPDENAGTFFLGFLAILLSGVAVHELGHAFATVLVKFKLISITVGPLVVQLGSGRARFRRSGFGLGGLTMAVPRGNENLRKRFMLIIAAGPAASVVAGLIGIAGGRALQFSSWAGWISAWGYVSVVLAVLSLVPIRKFYYSDGARLALLLRNSPAADRECAMLAIGAAVSAGTRPRDWSPELLRSACAGSYDGSSDALRAALCGYENALDTGKFDEAAKFLGLALANFNTYPPMTKAGVALDAAFFHAMVRAEAAIARAWLSKSNTKLVQDRYAVLMAEAAVSLAEGKIQEAKQRVDASRAALPHAMFAGFARAAEDWLNTIESRCNACAVAASTEN